MNEALRAALAAHGITRLDLAAALQVDPKTVERWLAGRVPHPRSRAAIASLVDLDEAELWPTRADPYDTRRFGTEIRAVYPRRSDVPRDVWLNLLANARQQIDILDSDGLFLSQDVAVLRILNDRAEAGIRIRLLLTYAQPTETAGSDAGGGVGGPCVPRVRDALAPLEPLAAHAAVELRHHCATLYTSVYRADDELLARPHINGAPAGDAPVLRVSHFTQRSLFSNYVESFSRSWRGQES